VRTRGEGWVDPGSAAAISRCAAILLQRIGFGYAAAFRYTRGLAESPEKIMPSFDIVSEVNEVELRNALDQCNKEVANRFDFKGSDARVEHGENELSIYADDEFKLGQVWDVLMNKMAKRGVDVRALERSDPEKIGGDKVKQKVVVKVGVDQELGKKIVRLMKDNKQLKVQASIQGDVVRVSGAKKDALQDAIALVKKSVTELPLQFKNFRD
jgi:uncharacterized protein YajQ (UPF0234 family)